MTVSRVVNGDPRVRTETAARVARAIETLGYRPDFAARALKGRQSRTIALMIADIANPFYADCAKAVEEVARAHGFAVILCTSDDRAAVERERIEVLSVRRIDGLLFVPASDGLSFAADPALVTFPVVALDRPPNGVYTDTVVTHDREGAELASRHLVEHGHRRIVFIGGGTHIYTTTMRAEGYTAVMHAAGLAPEIVTGASTIDLAREATLEILRRPAPPTALFAMNNLVTVGVLEAVEAAGARIPRDIAVVGFDDFALAALLRPRLTLVRHSAAELGRRGATLLFERMADPSLPPRHVDLPVQLMVRESCGCTESQRSDGSSVVPS